MIKNAKISVVMSTFNKNSKFFFESIYSIINQTFQNWELIIYDDCSENDYKDIFFGDKILDKRIFCIKGDKRRGLAYGLNVCIKLSSGDYIARMDDDDISDEDRLKKQYEFLNKNEKYDWVGCNAKLINSSGSFWGIQKVPERPLKRSFLFNSPYIHPSVMFRKEVLLKNKGYSVSKDNFGCEDYELFMRLHSKGYMGYNLQEPLISYREDYGSYRKRTFKRRFAELKTRYKGFKKLGILNVKNFIYVIKPIFMMVIPKLIIYLSKKYKNKLLNNLFLEGGKTLYENYRKPRIES